MCDYKPIKNMLSLWENDWIQQACFKLYKILKEPIIRLRKCNHLISRLVFREYWMLVWDITHSIHTKSIRRWQKCKDTGGMKIYDQVAKRINYIYIGIYENKPETNSKTADQFIGSLIKQKRF